MWLDVSRADLALLTTKAPQRVAAIYRRVLASEPDFNLNTIRKQLAIYRDLNVLSDNLTEVFKVVGEPPPLATPRAQPEGVEPRKRVLVFSGHMIDAPDRTNPRFPADKESVAREKIKEAIVSEMNTGAGVSSGYAGGASGGDLLFLEVCKELGIPTHLYLAMHPQIYVTHSVSNAGADWIERFWAIHAEHAARNRVRVLSQATDVVNDTEFLPAWLRDKSDYNIWQRTNLWILSNALVEGCDEKTGDPNLTLIALWDGEGGDGPGGTRDLVERVKRLGAQCEIIDTKKAFGL